MANRKDELKIPVSRSQIDAGKITETPPQPITYESLTRNRQSIEEYYCDQWEPDNDEP